MVIGSIEASKCETMPSFHQQVDIYPVLGFVNSCSACRSGDAARVDPSTGDRLYMVAVKSANVSRFARWHKRTYEIGLQGRVLTIRFSVGLQGGAKWGHPISLQIF